ncbi:MAG: serpin family protein [Candidatus Sericytochromatia bacterium]
MRKLLKASLASLIVLSACRAPSSSGDSSSSYNTKTSFPPITDTEKVKSDSKIVLANNKFGAKIFTEILKTDKDKNIFISPTSILFALSMTYNGAKANTKTEMEKALELTGMTTEEVNKGANALIRTLVNADSNVRLDIANSLWGKKNVKFSPDFLKNNEDFFKATTSNIDFNSEAVKMINTWVSNATQGKIPTIIDGQIDPNTLLFLINAIYFKGDWTNKFDKNLTKEEDFNLVSGSKKKVQMMSLYEKLAYYKGDNFQSLSLPYGKENISMYVFLPDNDLEDFYKQLYDSNLTEWFGKFSKKNGTLKLPKFKLEYEKTLNEILGSLGMSTAFTENADFSAMFTDNTKAAITNVKHKTFVEVNEEGTEAAAVTGVTVGATSVMIDEPYNMVFDKPFFYMIRDNSSGTILFMGEVVEP